jgi:molybdopterin converting factor small subunit
MPAVRIPSMLQAFTGGATAVDATGDTLRAVIEDVVRRHPDLAGRVLHGDAVADGIMLAVGGDEARDLDQPVPPDAEVHILPAIAGG